VAMNNSDRQNPRRLIRAIEVSVSSSPQPHQLATSQTLDSNSTITLGLIDTIEAITDRIEQRVAARLAAGALSEVERLLAEYPNQNLPLYSATGVKPLIQVATGQMSVEECQEFWSRQERQYAKRQLTWWKKQLDVTWFAIGPSNWQTQALDQIESWWET